jgi:hypothetical protein
MATSCASPTAMNSARCGRPGPTWSLSHSLLTPRRPPSRMLWSLQRLDAVDAPASARDKRERSADELRASPRSATHSLARRQPQRWGNARFQDRGPPSASTVLQRHTLPPPTPTWRRAGFAQAAMPRPSEITAPPPTMNRPAAPLASCHPPPRTGTRSGTSPACPTQ